MSSAPPTQLPRVAGIRLAVANCATVMSAPLSIAAGMKKRLAMLCSVPRATKAITGNQIPRILPVVERDE